MKEKGILLPIFSLPSKYGIGDFGYEAYQFINILSENNIKYWEVLPINECDKHPYSPISYYALEEDYISLDKLKEQGLIQKAETRENKGRAVYDNFKQKYYEEAFKNFKPDSEYEEFIKLKEMNEYAEFSSERSNYNKEYYLFLQYIAYKQWMELKQYANSKGIEIIGDMPVYPVFESVETQYNPECFEMENGKFTFESGTPPDYFNENGQKWNSPVYNVENLKKDNYQYLIKRFKYHLKLFDKVRVDYFRGYDSFFKIPIGKTGKEGFYTDGVSYGFFDELFKDKSINADNLIVEDLGEIREETVKLRKRYGFTRQKILQFSMETQINTGDLVVVKDAQNTELKNGDIIAFKNGDSVITHRIVDKVEEEGKIKYKTKGDNNNATDDWYVSPEQIEGIYQFKMSKLGNIAMFIQTPIGMIICLSIPIILIILTQMTASKEKQKDMEQEIEKLKKQNKELTQRNK